MYLSYGGVAVLFLCVLIAWFWQDSLRVRDVANGAAMDACARMGLQFLDGTVAFSKLQLTRDFGQLRLRRTYVFDYTAHSIGRLQGFVVVLGAQVETVGFARDEAQHARAAGHDAYRHDGNTIGPVNSIQPPPPAPSSDVRQPDSSGKVLNLDEWRRSRDTRH